MGVNGMAKRAKASKRTSEAKRTKGILEVFKKFGTFRTLPELEKLPVELRRLNEKWQTLPRHVQQGILILARVRPVPSATPLAERRPQAAPGETPEWLLMALNILKDSKGFLSDREISRRVGINHSTLCRNEAYKNAKRTYLQPFATPGRRGLREETES